MESFPVDVCAAFPLTWAAKGRPEGGFCRFDPGWRGSLPSAL
jgi:hypothetical protein